MKITLTTTKNQKNEEKNINVTTIDLKDCEKRLKDAYHIPYDEVLYMKKIDVIQDGMKIPKIEYEVYTKYNRSNLKKLNLSHCNDVKIDISIPHILTENIDKLNSSSKYYNDICYTSTSDSGTDIILKDRKEEFINNNKTVCQEKCIFSEYNYTIHKAKCSCDIEESSQNYNKMKINRAELIINYIDIKNIANINILVCYKILFSKKGILYNYGSYFLNITILLHLLVIIIFYSKNLFRNIEDIINEITFGIKNLHLFSKTKEELAVNIIKIKKNKKTKKKKSIKKKEN